MMEKGEQDQEMSQAGLTLLSESEYGHSDKQLLINHCFQVNIS